MIYSDWLRIFESKVVTKTFGLPGSAKANRREPKCCLGRVFNLNLGCFCYDRNCMAITSTLASKVENSAQILSC
jgi:hypothetical protein